MIDLKLSEELKELFENSKEMIMANDGYEITSAVITYQILKKYLNGGGVEKAIKEFIKDLNADDRVKLEKQLYKMAKKTIKQRPAIINLSKTDPISISDELYDVIDRVSKLDQLSKIINRKTTKNKEELITTDFLLASLLYEIDEPFIDLLVNDFDLGKDKLANCIIKNTIAEKLPGSVFPPKTETTSKKKKDDDKDKEDKKPDWTKWNGQEVSDDMFEAAGKVEDIKTEAVDPNSTTPNLDRFALDYTKKAKNGEFDTVVGRKNEVEEVFEILCCRKKNNAILLGDPGTGKTAVVELISSMIANGEVPGELKNKRIFSLDLNALVAGCIYRGQYEERLQNIIKEVITNKDIIIFIDEIHNLLGNGSSSGHGDGANILKPYLARGEFQCIGSTTNDEYRMFIEKDGALKRRFQPVFIDEPDEEKTYEILKGVTKEYGKFHKCQYPDEVLKKCVEWSGRYITDRFFPDKAFSILDMASAVAKLTRPYDKSNLTTLQKKRDDLDEEINKMVMDSDGDTDVLIKAGQKMDELKELEDKIKKTEEEENENSENWRQITLDDVSSVISKLSGVPLDKIMSSSTTKMREMKHALEAKVIGQDKAVTELTTALQRNILGIRDPKKPIASFLLVGPTGVGKTLISKILAEEFFGSEKSLLTIACSEYMQEWAESKLLGSAPGYVGFSDSEPRLYMLKRKPYTVLLIDEIEKSSSALYNIWLNMLEEGEVTMSNGEKISLRNTIIIFTSNVGTKSLELKGHGIGFGSESEEDRKKRKDDIVMKEVKSEFRPEFINRLSKIIIFNELGENEMNTIFDIEVEKVKSRYKEAGYNLEVTEDLKKYIISLCEPQYGARSLNRLIVEHVDQPICQEMLDAEKVTDKVKVDYKDNKVVVNFYG